MAHEIPIQVHQKAPPGSKTRKHRPVPQPKLKLPNGKQPDFGSHEKQKGSQTQQLPNGEKPDFGGKESKTRRKKTADTLKPKHADSPPSSDCYAGLSFHSSPEALALPKPLFATGSPKSGAGAGQQQQHAPPAQFSPPPQQQQHHQSPQGPIMTGTPPPRNIYNMPPAFVYQGMPALGPPRYPVAVHQPSMQPDLRYAANKQGFISYQQPVTAVPQPPLPMQSYPFQMYPPVPPPPMPNQQFGQRITFNELMGSSK